LAGAAHGREQAPQFATLLLVSTHTLPHFVKPALQVKPQVDPVHVGELLGGAVHTRPQPPQFEVSVAVFEHAPEQSVWPVMQPERHAPDEHTSAPAQGLSHSPQCVLLDCRLTHSPPQFV
jgi:hypothetical protein